MFWIYAFVNKINDRVYIGQSVQPETRLRQHKKALREKTHHCTFFQNAWEKYGEPAFDHLLIGAYETREEANDAERFFIGWYRELGLVYNSAHGGSESGHRCKYRIRTKEHSENIAKGVAAAWTPERRAEQAERKRGNKNFEGRTHSEEAKEKNRQSKLGENNPMYGKPTSDNQKEAASKRWKGVKRGPMSEETKQKLREARALQAKVPCSEETKAKIRQKALERAAVKKA